MGPNMSAKFSYLTFLIQTEFPLDYARGRVDAFLSEYTKWIAESLTDEEFNTCREGVLSELKTKPKNLGEEMSNWTRSLSERTYDFGARKRLIARLETGATLETLRAFVRDKMSLAPKLYIQCAKVVDKPDKALPEG